MGELNPIWWPWLVFLFALDKLVIGPLRFNFDVLDLTERWTKS